MVISSVSWYCDTICLVFVKSKHEVANFHFIVYFISKVLLRQFRDDWNLVWLHLFGATVIRSV